MMKKITTMNLKMKTNIYIYTYIYEKNRYN